MKDIPVEIVATLASQCSPHDLVALARVNRTYCIEAERLLYGKVTLDPSKKRRSQRCLKVLEGNPDKARLVRSLTFPFGLGTHQPDLLRAALCRVLPKLTHLKNLDIRARLDERWPETIAKALQRCTFSLETLRFTYGMDLLDWASRHQSLAVLSIDKADARVPRSDLASYRATFLGREAPILYCQDRDGALFTNVVVLFPAFAPVVDGVRQWSADRVGRHFASYASPTRIRELYVYFADLSDEVSLRPMLASIARNFWEATALTLRVEDGRIDNYSKSMPSMLAPFTNLASLSVTGWNWESGGENSVPVDRKARLAQGWIGECNVNSVQFADHTWMTRTANGSWEEWRT